jgi:hypothetical protein
MYCDTAPLNRRACGPTVVSESFGPTPSLRRNASPHLPENATWRHSAAAAGLWLRTAHGFGGLPAGGAGGVGAEGTVG